MMVDLNRVQLASGITLEVWEEGPPEAPALLFLHGFPESHRTWRHQIAHLSSRFRCIAPDLRGYGGSSRPAEVEAYATSLLVGDVFQLADALGIAQFTLLGHDWGGVLAWAAAAADAGIGRISRLVIANAPHPVLFQRRLFTDATQRHASQYIRQFRAPASDALIRRYGFATLLLRAFGQSAAITADTPPQEAARLLLTAFGAPERLHTENALAGAAALLARWREPGAASAMLNWYRASAIEVPDPDAPLALPDGWPDDLQAPAFPRLTLPTLVLWGENDPALPPANCDGLEEYVSDCTLTPIPDCGHFSPWQGAKAVNAALDLFLTR